MPTIHEINKIAQELSNTANKTTLDSKEQEYFVKGYLEGLQQLTAAIERHTPRTELHKVAPAPSDRRVRSKSTSTSLEAAMGVSTAKAQRYYELIQIHLTTLGKATHEELYAYITEQGIQTSETSLRVRCSELKDAGWLKDSGERGRTKAGNSAIKWQFIN